MKRFDYDFELTEFIAKGICAICFGGILLILCCGLLSESNRISEGVVVDKSYSPAYSTTYTFYQEGRVHMIPQYHASSYRIKLEGEKDGEVVTYWRNVTEQEYHQMEIGDYYPPSEEGA